MYSDFLNLVRTVEEVDLLVEEVRLISDSLFKKNVNDVKDIVNTQVRAKFSGLFRDLLINSKDPRISLEELNEVLLKMDTVKITLAFEPTDAFIDKLILFIRESAGNNLVLDISTDPIIGGGAVISFRGEYRDFSLSKFMEIELTEHREEIIKLLEDKTKVNVAEPQ